MPKKEVMVPKPSMLREAFLAYYSTILAPTSYEIFSFIMEGNLVPDLYNKLAM